MSSSSPSNGKKLKIRYFNWRFYRKKMASYGAPLLFERCYDTQRVEEDADVTFLPLPELYLGLQYPKKLDQVQGTRVAVSEEYWTRHGDWLSDYTFSYRPTTDRNYYLPLYRVFESYEQLLAPRDPEALLARKRGFCSFVYSNPDTAFPGVGTRLRFFDKLHPLKFVDALGSVKYNNAKALNYTRHADNYRELKREIIAPYKFDIAFENMRAPGYHTEKLTGAFIAGVVPIYSGDPNVNQIFNPRAFINIDDFDSMDDAIRWILTVDRNDDLYKSYLAEPPFRDNREPEILNIEPLRARMDEIIHEPRSAVGKSRFRRQQARRMLKPPLNPHSRFLYSLKFNPQHGALTVIGRALVEPFRLASTVIGNFRKRRIA